MRDLEDTTDDTAVGAGQTETALDRGEVDPAERFGHLFHLIGDAVVEFELVETMPIVRAVNPAFEEVFGYDAEEIVGESLNEYIIPPTHDTQATDFDRRTAAGKENYAIVSRQTATGVREFLYRGVPYPGGDGRTFGFAIYSDITDQRTYERHIHVIHRILRHNLRNDLTVILGAASQIEALSDDPAVSEQVELISRHGNALAGISREAQTLEQVLTSDENTRRLELGPLCQRVVTDLASAHPESSVTVDVPRALAVKAVPELRSAVESLVENGLLHGESCVRLDARRDGQWVQLEVVDDGPGIPETEREPVFGGDDITQLNHGSGIGLWLVRCVIDVSSGHMEYERTDDGRTIVRLRLHAA